jgi:acyl carrier protein
MHHQEALERLRALLAPRLAGLGLTQRDVKDDMSLTQSGVLDSFAMMELLARAEEAFGVQLDLDGLEVAAFTTLNGLAAALIKAKGS